MKKVLIAVMCVLMIASLVHTAERSVIRLGLLSKLNTTEEEFGEAWQKTFAPKNGSLQVIVKFYDTLTAMQMALNAGEIHQAVLPEAVAEYVLSVNTQAEATLVLPSRGMGLAFGFREDSKELRDRFSEAIRAMREDWTLPAIEGVYTAKPGEYEPVKFSVFPGAQTIRAAVTGDLPPIDYIAPDGTPSGFNTAVLAEIGRRLHVNIELAEVDTGARTAALASGRADVVFWYEVDTSSQTQPDIPGGVIISEPYYEWHKFIHIRKAPPKAETSRWNILNSILNLYNTER
ncbi:MAG: transporter substrate-binding domain-containing protein [Synergistaceae bacterium]|nr:transporter substrate-binding domain-containing protein [Synergistaceae bacterium]